jgi:hypothetical protein
MNNFYQLHLQFQNNTNLKSTRNQKTQERCCANNLFCNREPMFGSHEKNGIELLVFRRSLHRAYAEGKVIWRGPWIKKKNNECNYFMSYRVIRFG